MKTFPSVKQTRQGQLKQGLLLQLSFFSFLNKGRAAITCALAAGLLLFSQAIFAQVVAWELSAEPGNQASSAGINLNANFTNNGLTRGAGITAAAGAGSMNSSAWFSSSTPTTLADAIANNDYYEFTVNTINCLFFNPTTIQIVLRSSATGPNTATLRCSSDGFTADIGTVAVSTTSVNHSFSETISPISQSVTYRLYGYGGAAGGVGSTPSSGGTMRIGTSVNAADNDIAVFATSTSLTVNQVVNITVTDGDAVPITALTANVPGATVNWSRTPETIGLPATNGTGNIPAFNAFNASGVPVTSTFTVNATANGCTSANMVFTITVNPAPCTITVDFFGNPSACNDNGTPNDPSDDFFTQNIHANFFNRPSTGSLQIVPGGDQIGTYSIPVNQIIGNSHLFSAVQLKADGTPSVVQMNFTDNPGCIDADTGPTVQPCSANAPPCEIIGFSFANIGSCNDNGTPSDPADDFFTCNVDVLYSNSIIGAVVTLQGTDVVSSPNVSAVIGTNVTSTLNGVNFRADGQAVDFTGILTDLLLSQCTLPGTGPAVNSCSNGPICEVIGFNLTNVSGCNDSGTPSDPSDDFFSADVEMIYSNSTSTNTLGLGGSDLLLVPDNGAPSAVGTNISFVFHGVRFRATGVPVHFVGVISTGNGTCDFLSTDGPSVPPCSFLPPVLTCPIPVTVSCVDQVPPANPASVTETHTCPGAVTVTHLGDVNSSVTCINRLTITRTYQATDLCGNTSTCTQTITVNDQTPPTVTCPVNVTVNCASNVPPVDLNSLGVTDNCAGTIGISRTFIGEVVTNQTCPNRFTLTRTYRGGDACGNTANCTQVITVNNQIAPIVPPNGASQVACPALIVTPTPPAVNSACGQPITPTGPVITNSPATITCEGTRTFTFTYTDCEGNTAQWSHVTTVERQPFTVPANTASNVACPALIVQPTPPTVLSNCGEVLTPTGPVIVNNPNPITCEGTRTFTWTFTDCEGNTAQWSHVTTVERLPFTIPAPNGNATVACPEQTDTQPIPPVVTSNCGEVLVPVISASAEPGCEGDRLYTFHYTDCEGNTADWFFNYHVEYLDFAVPANEVVNVECPSNVIVPTPPIVFDNCGNQLTPTGPVITSQSNAQACETSRQYTFTYIDCEGNTHVWSKTFNFSLSADFFVYPDQEDYVACLIYAQAPVPPTIYDICGREIVVSLTSTTEDISATGCSGWRKFVFTYSDCGGHSHTWSYTYFANDDQPPLGDCVSGAVDVKNLACIEEVPCPDDFDFGEKIAEMLSAGNIYDECSGTDLVVELDSWSALWQCSDPNGDGVNTFGRTFYFRIADPCGNEMPSLCSVTYAGACLPIETFPQGAWGITGDEPGSDQSSNTTDLQVITDLLNQGPLVIGGSDRSISLSNAQCVVDLLPGIGYPTVLANCQQVNCGGCNPAGTIGMKNKLAANTIALTLNLRYNVLYNHLLMNALRAQQLDCIEIDDDITVCTENGVCKFLIWETDGTPHEFPYTLGGLLDLANLYLDGSLSLSVGNNLVIADGLNLSIENVNTYWHQSSFVASCDTGSGIAKPTEQVEKALPKQKIAQAEMRLVPNPASRELRFELAKLAEAQEVVLEFYNLYGQAVLRREFGKVASVNERIDLDGLGTGVYFVRVKAGEAQYQQKLFITRD